MLMQPGTRSCALYMCYFDAAVDLELARCHLLCRPQPLPEAKNVVKAHLPSELADQHPEGKHPG